MPPNRARMGGPQELMTEGTRGREREDRVGAILYSAISPP